MTRLPFLAAIPLLVLIFSGAGSCARAQEQMPSFNLPVLITQDDIEDLSVDFNDAFDMIENAYFSDTIKLNYQISLLEKLVTRQAAIAKISESYQSMGMTFPEQPPARGICAQLPANAPCLKSYPDLYSDMVAERKAHYDEIEARLRAADPANPSATAEDPEAAARRKKEAAERARKEAERERKERYRWTDLTCLSGQCHAVLTKAGDYRTTVREGSRLADGTLVKSISADGVSVSIDGDLVRVRPAPGEAGATKTSVASDNPIARSLAAAGIASNGSQLGGTVAPAQDSSGPSINAVNPDTASIVAGISANNAGASPAANTTGTAGTPAAPAGQTVSEPALGPSGLF